MKRSGFQKIIDALAQDVVPFAVFPALDDVGALSPHERSAAGAFVAWSREAERAFDGAGALVQPFGFHFGGQLARLAMAFANAGVPVRLDVEARSWDEDRPAHIDARLLKAYGVVGTGVIPVGAARTDVIRMVDAFRAMRKEGIVALACEGFTQSDGWTAVAERQRGERQTAVFWTEQGHDAFDATGSLSRTLCLYWRGDASRIARHLRDEGLSALEPRTESRAIDVSSAHPPAGIPRFDEVLPDEPRPATKPTAQAKGERAGSFTLLARGRSTEALPIRRLALHEGRLAVAHGYDTRGWPAHPVILLDTKSGAVARTFPAAAHAALAHSLRFLRDGRLAFGVSDFVARSACTPLSTGSPASRSRSPSGRRIVRRPTDKPIDNGAERVAAGVARLWDPATDEERTLRTYGFSHGPAVEVFGVTEDARTGVVASPEGALLFSLESGDELSRLGGKPDAYPVVAIAPDGSALVWTHDAGPEVKVLSREGALLFSASPFSGHGGGRGFFAVGFDPSSRFAVLGCRRTWDDGSGWREARTVELYALPDGARTMPAVEAAAQDARSFAFDVEGALLAVGRADGVVKLIDVPSGAPRGEGRLLDAAITALAFARDGRLVAGDEHGRYAIASC